MARAFKRGRIWWIDYHAHGKRYRESVGPNKREAERALAKRQIEIREGKFLDVRRRCTTTLDEFAPAFLDWAKRNKRSWKRDTLSLRNLCKRLGPKNLEKITTADVERYTAARLGGTLVFGGKLPSPATVNRELACLRKVLNLAVDLEVLAENHLAGKIKMQKESEGRLRYLEPAEADKLLEACADHLRPVVHLAMLTGMRRSEIVGLRWAEVDLARGVIRLPGERTKNGRARAVPLSQDARRVLVAARELRLEECPLVFHRPDGSPLGDFKKAWAGACRRAGVEGLHFHDLRHAFASALAMRGVPLHTIGELLGHRTPSMTLRYSHLSPEALQGAAEQASSYMRGSEPNGVARLPAQQGARAGDWHKTGTVGEDGQVIPLHREAVAE